MVAYHNRTLVHVLLLLIGCQSQELAAVTTYPFFIGNMASEGPTSVHVLVVSNCTYENFNGFLKEVCIINNHKYFKCSRSNRFYRITSHSCREVVFSRLCPNDKVFYQACGRVKCNGRQPQAGGMSVSMPSSNLGLEFSVCGDVVCRDVNDFSSTWSSKYHSAFAGNDLFWSLTRCNGKNECLNSIDGVSVDEYGCENENASSLPGFKCTLDPITSIKREHECDNICNCNGCDEEARCNNMTIGIFCFERFTREKMYVHPIKICDFKQHCVSGIDEKLCEDYNETCSSFSLVPGHPGTTRVLTPWSKCSIPNNRPDAMLKVCTDYRDQMNCSFSTISPLICNVDGYPTTISEHVICKDSIIRICDDKLEKECAHAEFECKIHKHRFCDGLKDCMNGGDENEPFCEGMVHEPIDCIRRW